MDTDDFFAIVFLFALGCLGGLVMGMLLGYSASALIGMFFGVLIGKIVFGVAEDKDVTEEGE